MKYFVQKEERYRKSSDNRMYEGKKGCSIGTHRSLHSPLEGARLEGDRARNAGDVTHDYSNVLGWNIRENQKKLQA